MNKNIGDRFQHTRRNDGNTMADHLKMYKDNAVVYGTIIEEPHVNFPANVPMNYYNFICRPWWTTGDPPDGDLVFRIRVDASRLAPDFWMSGFVFGDGENTAQQIQAKLIDSRGELEVELIMYGRSGECAPTRDLDPGEALLPGWVDPTYSVLLDGQPINGQVTFGPSIGAGNREVAAILGKPLSSGTLVRVTGVLVVDCHGDWWNPTTWTGDCSEDDADVHNVEIHPAYAIDIGTDPCRGEADRLRQLQSELAALASEIPHSREAGERLGEAELERRFQRAQARISAWHAQHDAEMQQLRDRLASPACHIQWQTQPNTTPR
jgi:hypothetical protein